MITAIQAIKKLPTDVNFSEEKLKANISTAEYRWGQKFLGDAFWNDIEKNIDTNNDYKVLWQQILWEYLSYAVLFESRININWNISTQGFMLNNTEFSQSDRNAYKTISNFLTDRLAILQDKLNKFLTDYPSRFPLYPNNKDGCCNRPESINDYFGVNMTVVEKHTCCDRNEQEPPFPDYMPPEDEKYQFNANCPSGITVNGLYKNDDLLDTELPKDFEDIDDLLIYLKSYDSSWYKDGNYVLIESFDNWNLMICCK